MFRFQFVATLVLAMPATAAFAQTNTTPASPTAPTGVPTAHGTGLVTGTSGTSQTIMIPGSAVGGWVVPNGNGTSTIMIPGAPPQVVPMPR